MNWKLYNTCILASAFVLSSAIDASACDKKNKKVPGYLAIGASYTYGYGAEGNDDGGIPRTNENPGFGYTDAVFEYLLDQHGNKRMEHLNTAIGGATSAEINEFQLEEAVEFLQEHKRTVIEIASGGNDLLGFMLFPDVLPEEAIGGHLACNMNSPHYDALTCDWVISNIVAGVEANLRITLDTIIDNMPKGSIIVLRSFPNAIAHGNTTPGHVSQPFPVPFTCEGLPSQTEPTGAMHHFYSTNAMEANGGYSVATRADQIGHILNADTDTLEGVNVMLARVAAEYADDGYKIAFADVSASSINGVHWDCIHPSDAGHDAIADIMIDTIEDLDCRGRHCRHCRHCRH